MIQSLASWLSHSRTLSYLQRVIIVAGSILCCAIVFMITFSFTREGSFFAIPVALSAWFFERKEPWICLCITLLTIAIINCIHLHTFIWPNNLALAFFISALILSIEIVMVYLLKSVFDTYYTSMQRARDAESQIAKAYEQQHQLNTLKDQIIIHINHELKTPLTEIHGYLDLLQEQIESISPQESKALLLPALLGCQDLANIIDSILFTAQLESGQIVQKCVKLPLLSIIQDVLHQFDPRDTSAYSIHISIPDTLAIHADGLSVRQILRNIFSNIFKYVPRQTPILIQASVELPDVSVSPKEMVCIRITDKGSGIPPEAQSLLFQRFVRLPHHLASDISGNGLGLYISKQLIEAMGGQIWIESPVQNGKGSCFAFTLPLAKSSEENTSTPM